jgi:hypothetical protein
MNNVPKHFKTLAPLYDRFVGSDVPERIISNLRLPPDAPPPWQRQAAAIRANTRVLPGLGGAAAALGGQTLFGFADAPEPALDLGGPEDLRAYLRAYPDDVPVATVADAEGNIRARYFDPGLRRPFAAVGPAPATLLPGFGEAITAQGLAAKGPIDGQTVSIGSAKVTLPVRAPAGARLLLGADGKGLVHFAPVYDRPLAALLGETFLGDALAAVPGQPALTCSGDAPCYLTYAVSAAPAPAGGAPITGFRLAFYPRVLTDGTGHNRIEAAYSTDGAHYEPLAELRSVGDFFWYGGAMRLAREVKLPRPADRLYLRFALSGGGAQLWSAPATPLTLDVTLGDTGFHGLPLPAGPTSVISPDGAVGLLPTRLPPPFGDSLREGL